MTGHHSDHGSDALPGDRPDDLPALVMPDDAFLETFERGDFAGESFPLRAHLRMAWLYVTAFGPDEAIQKAAAGIRNLARQNGRPGLYHDTLTRAWVYVVAAAIGHSPASSFTRFLALSPQLLDKHLLRNHYSPDLLASPRARATWVEPDLRPIPGASPSSP